MILKEIYLVAINSRNKIQRVKMKLTKNPYTNIYSIERMSGQYGGKETDYPSIDISHGKVLRTAEEQAILQYNSYVKRYKDKGYVQLDILTKTPYEQLTEEEIKTLLGDKVVSDQAGIPKPMLAKLADQCSSDIWEKEWYISRKLNGKLKNLCRC